MALNSLFENEYSRKLIDKPVMFDPITCQAEGLVKCVKDEKGDLIFLF